MKCNYLMICNLLAKVPLGAVYYDTGFCLVSVTVSDTNSIV